MTVLTQLLRGQETRASQSPLEQIKAGILTLGEDEHKESVSWLQSL
jgi:hypothetical protein